MKLKLLPFILAPLLTTAILPAHADDSAMMVLFKMLHDKGSIDDQEYALLLSAAKAEKKADDEVKQQIATITEEDEKSASVSVNGGHLKIKSADKEFEMKIGGRIMADYAFIDEDDFNGAGNHGNASEIRRARLFAAGTVFTDWQYKAQFEFAGNGTSIKDMYIRYRGWNPAAITLGNQHVPFGLEQMTSSKYTTFIERSVASDAFSLGRKNGLRFASGGEHWSLSAMAHLTGIDNDNSDQDEDYGYGFRATYAPIAEKTRSVHFGAAAHHQEYEKSGGVLKQLEIRPEVHSAGKLFSSFEDTVKSANTYGLELAGVYGPFSFQSEYARREYNAISASKDQSLDSWYAYASYFITGESRVYKAKTGSFARVKPINQRYGAWEVALRYSELDLEDNGLGTKGDVTSLGLNWYATPTIRFMADYTTADVDGSADDFDALHFRGQIDF